MSKDSGGVRIDLRRDAEKIGAYIKKRVRAQMKKSPKVPVSRIDLGFYYCEDAFVALCFDTRPNAEPDGEWAQNIKDELKMPQWSKAAEAPDETMLHIILPNGKERIISAGEKDFEAVFALLGDLLKNRLLSARAEGVFEPLRKAGRCELGVEELEGNYGWPAYGDRGKKNLA
jgi:hypothetical protein